MIYDVLSDSDFEETIAMDKECAKSEDDRECVQVKNKELVFLIGWSTRDKLVQQLTHYLTLLYTNTGGPSPKKEQTRLSQKLVGKLMNLAVKSNRSSGIQQESGQAILEIGHELRNDVIANLISNNDSQQYGQHFREQIKPRLLAESDKILKALLALPVYICKDNAIKKGEFGCEISTIS